ncbi:MAG: DNA-3-methyladenine glycosylase 2 family protein [Pseudomonadota bacterium]
MSAPGQRALDAACEALSQADPALARAHKAIGRPIWRSAEPCYASIARTIAYQQISTAAAGTIWGRVCDDLGEITHSAVLACTEERLRAHGLSRPKIRHLMSIASAIETGALDLDRVCKADLDEARAELTAVKGIGPWTAELFLLYAVGEMDAFPTADVGLMESHKLLSGADVRMDPKAFTVHAESWRPYRGVAAHLLWGWINAERDKMRRASPQP